MLSKFKIKPVKYNDEERANDLFELRFGPESDDMTNNVINFTHDGQHIFIIFADQMVGDKSLFNIVDKWMFETIELIEFDRSGVEINRKKWNIRLDEIVRIRYAYNQIPQFITIFNKV